DGKDALQSLPEEFRLAVYLADIEGFAYKEIAEIMDTPIGTVMSRLHRGRKQLQVLHADYARERGLVKVGSTSSSDAEGANSSWASVQEAWTGTRSWPMCTCTWTMSPTVKYECAFA